MFVPKAYEMIDSYKLGHFDQYPPNTTRVYSNFTPRSMKYFKVPNEFKDDRVVVFGTQAFLQQLVDTFDTTFFNVEPNWEEVEQFFAPFCGRNGFNSAHLQALHKLGYLPLKIKSLPEGSLVPIGVPVMTITNTIDEFFWLPGFLETWLSAEQWKPMTSATTAFAYRRIAEHYTKLTGGSKEFIQWQVHDFASRGMSGLRDAAICGAGHLTSFTGTDNVTAVALVNRMYRGKETFVGGSVNASEHSVMCGNVLSISDEDFAKYEAEFDAR